MGNKCFKNKRETLSERESYKLKQIMIEKLVNCFICDRKNVYGFKVTSVIEAETLFICMECKNLK